MITPSLDREAALSGSPDSAAVAKARWPTVWTSNSTNKNIPASFSMAITSVMVSTPVLKILEPIHGAEFARRFGLGFSAQDREENIRRIGCVAEIFCAAGILALTAFVSPYRQDRQRVRQLVCRQGSADDFVEVFVDTPLDVCESRDPKGLYQKARAGEIKGFTGIDAPYEAPERPELRLDGTQPAEQLADQVISYLGSIQKL